MTRTEGLTEVGELSGRVLGIIGAYGMGPAVDAHDLYPKTAATGPPPKPVVVRPNGYIRDGVYHIAT